jgi:2-dehydro-3-deoxygluconokinase
MNAFSKGSGTVLSFGELLLRICPDADGEWLKKNILPFYVGGAELNVATALALWEIPSRYFTVIPDNGLSKQIMNQLSLQKIDTSSIRLAGQRLGLYFLTQGKDLKHNALIYDRAGSSFSAMEPGTIDWDNVLDGVSWFHFSAICPAISQNVADVCLEAIQIAKEKGITVSVDLNYRSRLWQYGKQPNEVMPLLLPYCDLVMGNVWAADLMLDIPVSATLNETSSKSAYHQCALRTSEQIIKRYPDCKAVANTFRFDQQEGIAYYSTLYTDDRFVTSPVYLADQITDKVGSGDCFMAGLIYGFYRDWSYKDILDYATAAAFEKLFIKSDATTKTVNEIKKAIRYE